MFCTVCGNQVINHARFCSKCGTEQSAMRAEPPQKNETKPIQQSDSISVASAPEKNSEAKSDIPLKKKTFDYWNIVLTVAVIALARFFSEIGLGIAPWVTIILLALAGWLGAYCAKKLKRESYSNVIVWACVVSWLIPFAGLFTAIFALTLASRSPKNQKRNQYLGWICLVASLVLVIGNYVYYYKEIATS